MTTEDFIIDLFCRVDDRMEHVPQHGQAALWPSEVVTLGLLFALKGVGGRAFYRWLRRDYADWFPRLPERTRWFRRLKTLATLEGTSGEPKIDRKPQRLAVAGIRFRVSSEFGIQPVSRIGVVMATILARRVRNGCA